MLGGVATVMSLGTTAALARLHGGTASGGGGGGGTLPTTMTLVNTSGSTQAANFISPIFGMTFKKGDIASGTAPIFTGTVSTTVYPYSWGLQSYYGDGSLRHASFMFICKDSIAGNANLSVTIASGGTAPSASSRTLTEVYAQNLYVGGPGVGAFGGLTGTWSGYLTNDSNNLYQYVYLDGQAGKSWRIGTNMATTKGGSAHGQLIVDHYITALQDVSGNLGGFRHIGRITQPYYDHDSPTKALRAFTSVSTKYGAGPTTINLTWPYSTTNFIGSNGSATFTVAAAGTQNFYSGALPGEASSYVNCVPGYLTATTDAALSTSQIYFAYTTGAPSNNTVFNLSIQNIATPLISSSGGTGTFVPIPVCLHGGSIYTADSQGRSNFFQGTGSLAADNTVRTQFNRTYLHSTGALPPWNLSVSGVAFGGTIKDIPDAAGSAAKPYWNGTPTWTPCSCGPMSPFNRGQGGSNPDIGPLQLWHACHFYNQSAVADLAVRTIGFASDFEGIGSVRDYTTGGYINVSNTSYTGMPAPSGAQQSTIMIINNNVYGFTAPSQPTQGNYGFVWGAEQNNAHKPNMAFYAFLVFGEPHFHDLMIEQGTGSLLEFSAGARVPSGTAPAGYGIAMAAQSGDLRNSAWTFRDVFLPAIFAADPANNGTGVDGSQVPKYLKDLAAGNMTWANAMYSSTFLGTPLNSQNSWRQIFPDGTYLDSASCGGFMMGYFECVVAWYAALGNSDALAWVNNYATWINYVVNTLGGYHLYAEFDGAFLFDSAGNETGPITSLTQYGIIAGMMTSVSWTTSSPHFTANSPILGYVVTAGDKWIWGADQTPNGSPPGGFANNTPYYAVNVSGNNFDLSATIGGSAIAATNSGTLVQANGLATGFGTPWIILAAPPAASSGLIPSSTPASNPDSYCAYRALAFNWAAAAGASGYANAITDATTRQSNAGIDYSTNANWYGQNTF